MDSSVPRWLQKTAAISWRLLVVGAVVWGATIVLAELRVLIIPAILSLFVGCLATPVSHRLRARGLGRLPTTLIVFAATALLFTGVVWFISAQIANSVDQINESIDEATVQITDWLADGPFGLTEARVDELVDQARQAITDNTEGLIGGLAGGAATVLEVITGFLLMLVFAFFIIKDGDRFWAWLVEFVGEADRRERVERIGRRSWVTLRNYLGGTALVGLADAVLIGIGLLILGVPLVVPLALLVFFGAFFPLIGATISGAVAVLVALATVGVAQALILVGIVLGVQRLEGDILMPILIGKAVDMHPLLIIVALTIGFIVAGLIGGFLAVPILAVGIVIAKDFVAGPRDETQREITPPA
jgi:predicted PurR-regulated permease PerM